jgi:hypothetical protein
MIAWRRGSEWDGERPWVTWALLVLLLAAQLAGGGSPVVQARLGLVPADPRLPALVAHRRRVARARRALDRRDREGLRRHRSRPVGEPRVRRLPHLARREARARFVAAGLYKAFAERRDLAENNLANAIEETVPLYETYEERIKELRDWARTRARPATLDAKMVDLFGGRP